MHRQQFEMNLQVIRGQTAGARLAQSIVASTCLPDALFFRVQASIKDLDFLRGMLRAIQKTLEGRL